MGYWASVDCLRHALVNHQGDLWCFVPIFCLIFLTDNKPHPPSVSFKIIFFTNKGYLGSCVFLMALPSIRSAYWHTSRLVPREDKTARHFWLSGSPLHQRLHGFPLWPGRETWQAARWTSTNQNSPTFKTCVTYIGEWGIDPLKCFSWPTPTMNGSLSCCFRGVRS